MKKGALFVLFVFVSLNDPASARISSTCACDKNPKTTESPVIADYNVRINEEGTVFNEKVEIDEKRQTETFKVPAHNDVEESEILNDFKMNLTMVRSHIKKICYLMPLDSNIPTPKDLKEYMDKASTTPSVKKNKLQERKGTFSVAEEVTDRTVLSDELASFCAKYPIFRLHEVPEATVTNITKTAEKPEEPSTREKRNPRFRRQSSTCPNNKLAINPTVERCAGGMCLAQARKTCVWPRGDPTLYCQRARLLTCFYYMRCRRVNCNRNSCTYNCFNAHNRVWVICCQYRCG